MLRVAENPRHQKLLAWSLLALAAAAPVVLLALAARAPLQQLPSEGALGTFVGVSVITTGVFGVLALRAYLTSGNFAVAAIGAGLLSAAGVHVWQGVFVSAGDPDEFGLYGAVARAFAAFGLLALASRTVTTTREARLGVVALVGASATLASAFGLLYGLGLVPAAASDGAGRVQAAALVELVTLVTLLVVFVRLLPLLGREEATLALPAAVALGAMEAVLLLVSDAWTVVWWSAQFVGIASVVLLGWAIFGFILRKERESVSIDAAQARAERLSSLGTLVVGVAHEINNPLAFMRGNIELAIGDVEAARGALREGRAKDVPDLGEAVDGLKVALQGTERIATITRSLKAVAREAPGEHAPMDLNEVVTSMGSLVRAALPKNVAFVPELAPGRVSVMGNASEIHQVLLNLVRNAADAIGSAPGTVAVRVHHLGHMAEVEVADDGPGMPAHVRDRLFTPFFTTKQHGTGLGLSIAQSIVKAHDGSIVVESEPGRGTRFRVRLPTGTPTEVEKRLDEVF